MAQSPGSYAFPKSTLARQTLGPPQTSAVQSCLAGTTAAAPQNPTGLASPPLSSPSALTGVELEGLYKDELIELIRKHLPSQPAVPDVDPVSLDRLRRPSPQLPRVRKKASRAEDASSVPVQNLISRLVKGQGDSALPAPVEPVLAQDCMLKDSLVISVSSPDHLVEAARSSPKTEQAQDQFTIPKSSKQSAKRDRNQPPRPSNPWILYRSAQIQQLRADPRFVKTSQGEISKLISYMWRDEDSQVRLKYEQLAAEVKARHAHKYPGYTYRPAKRVRRKAELAADGNSPSFTSSPSDPGVSGPSKGSNRPDHSFSTHLTALRLPFELPSASLTTQSWDHLTHASSNASWLPSIPSTPAALDVSISDLLAPINKQSAVNTHGYALNPMLDCADSLWCSNASSSCSDADHGSPASSAFTLGDHLVPLSAPAAHSFFDFSLVPSVLDQTVPVPNAPLSPALLASTPLASCPSVDSCSMASDRSMCSLSPSMYEDNGDDSASTTAQGNLYKEWLYPASMTPGQ